tara:strand:+ start:2045 stop:2701 length:657 start_codon:yes stop_codon:yes gene_type:complete
VEKYKVAIIIPAFNEELTISNQIKSAKKYGLVIVVNDGSTDKTYDKAIKAGAIVINHKINKGYDKALSSGFAKANKIGCKIIITFDGDGQHDPKAIKKFINLINKGYDVVIGVRKNYQRVSEYIFSLVTNFIWGIKDPLCGMKGYNIRVYKKVGYFSSYDSIGTELCIKSCKLGFKIFQKPLKIFNRHGKSRFGTIYANVKILKALYNLRNIKKNIIN